MHRVLVVDDEEEVVTFLCNFLRRINIASTRALSGKEAIELFRKGEYLWVFLDVKMPDMNGFDVLKEMKKINSRVKVIMITGSSAQDVKTKARKEGVIGFIRKPLDLEELHTVIEENLIRKN